MHVHCSSLEHVAYSKPFGGKELVFKPVWRDSSEIYHCLLLISFCKSWFKPPTIWDQLFLTTVSALPRVNLYQWPTDSSPPALHQLTQTHKISQTPNQRGLKYTEHKPVGRPYLGVTRTTMSSAVHTLTQVMARFTIMLVIVHNDIYMYSWCCKF